MNEVGGLEKRLPWNQATMTCVACGPVIEDEAVRWYTVVRRACDSASAAAAWVDDDDNDDDDAAADDAHANDHYNLWTTWRGEAIPSHVFDDWWLPVAPSTEVSSIMPSAVRVSSEEGVQDRIWQPRPTPRPSRRCQNVLSSYYK